MKEYLEYIERMEEIRRLSSPSLDDISDADEYSVLLRENFTRIGQLAALNRQFLDSVLYPLIGSESIDEDLAGDLMDFTDQMISAETMENIDLPMGAIVSDRLLEEANKKGDLMEQLAVYDILIGILYELMNMTMRIRAYPEVADSFRKKGFKIGKIFFDLTDKEKLASIDDMDVRFMIVINARYSIAFYEGVYGDKRSNVEQLKKLDQMYDMANDPEYRELLPGFDWVYHLYRVYQYYLMALENNNSYGFDKDQIEHIYERGRLIEDLWKDNHEHLEEALQGEEERSSTVMFIYRTEYLSGRKSREEYIDSMLKLYQKRDTVTFKAGKSYLNFVIPMELTVIISSGFISEREKTILHGFYQDILNYAFRIPNTGMMSGMLEYLYGIIESFVEIPSRLTFEEMVLKCMAAIHPPTYVHSLMVGQITECICKHVLRLMPEKLIGVRGYSSLDEVMENSEDIIRFAYHSAVCHDFGKISIIDTVFVYGRKLSDMEFDLIKTHPKTGYELMKRYASTREYADVAYGHHKWYDNSKGYPEEFDTSTSPSKPIIDIVLCADCLDAATDTIGRSYNKGKGVAEFTEELREGSGTRYAPWLCELFEDPLVQEDISYLLEEGRKTNYRNTYYLLRDIHER